MHPYIGEFIGTSLLILLGNGVVANVLLPKTKAHGSDWIVIAFGWGMAVFVAVWCVGPISGAHINPAVTTGLALTGHFPPQEVPGYIAAQMLGALLGASLVYVFYRDHYRDCDDKAAMLATFCTAPAIRRSSSNLISEVIGTTVLVFAVLMAVSPTIEVAGGSNAGVTIGLGTLGALPVGLLVFAIGLSLGGTTGYAINPARDLAPRIAHGMLPIPGKGSGDWSYAWIPVCGPLLGAGLAAALYVLLNA